MPNRIKYLNEWKYWSFVLFVCICIFSYPFISTQYLDRTDVSFHLNRIEGIKEGLLALEIPVRIHGYQMNGYGTADGVMYPDLFLYFPAILRILGVPVEIAWNVFWIFLIAFGLVISVLGYTLWTNDLRSGVAATVLHSSVLLYVYIMGQMVGDYPAVMTLPLAFAAMLKILQSEANAKYWIFFVIAFTVICENHVINTLFVVVAGLFACIYYRKAFLNPIQRASILKAAGFSLLLNLWHILPFLYFYKNVAFHINNPPLYESLHTNTTTLTLLFKNAFFIGWPIVALTIFFLFKRYQNKKFIYSVIFMVFLVLTDWKYFPWEFIEKNFPFGSFLPNFQLPVRFFSIGLIFLCLFLGEFLADILKSKKNVIAAIGVFIVAFSLLYQYNVPKYYEGGDLADIGFGTYKKLEILPSYTSNLGVVQEDYLYADVDFHKLRNSKGEVYNSDDYKSDAVIFDAKKQATRLEFSYIADKDTKAQVPLFYWKGYEAKNEKGERLYVNSGEHRFMEVEIPKGEGRVFVHYAGLWSFRICDIISLISLTVFLFLCKRERERLLL